MVAKNSQFVSHFIHNVNQIFTIRNCSYNFTLNRVTTIHQCHIRCFFFNPFFVRNQTCISNILINTAMNITRIENNYIILNHRCIRFRHGFCLVLTTSNTASYRKCNDKHFSYTFLQYFLPPTAITIIFL